MVEASKRPECAQPTVWYNYRAFRVNVWPSRSSIPEKNTLRPHLPLYRATSCRTGRSPRLPQKGGTGSIGGRFAARQRAPRSRGDVCWAQLHRHGGFWLKRQRDHRSCDDGKPSFKERKHNLTGTGGEGRGIDDACASLPVRDNGSLGLFEYRPGMPRGPQGPLHAGGTNGEKRIDSSGDLHELHRLLMCSITRRKAPLRGLRSDFPQSPATGGQSYMKHSWVTRACRFRYGNTKFVSAIRFADFLGSRRRRPKPWARADVPVDALETLGECADGRDWRAPQRTGGHGQEDG